MQSVNTPRLVSFSISSTSVTAAAVAETLGLEPDSRSVRGSRNLDLPSPRNHVWRIIDDSGKRHIDDQAHAIVGRLRPHVEGLQRLSAHDEVQLGMSLLRELGSTTPRADIGWHLDQDVLAFLVAVGADLDCDEYVLEPTFVDALVSCIKLRRENAEIFLASRRARHRRRSDG